MLYVYSFVTFIFFASSVNMWNLALDFLDLFRLTISNSDRLLNLRSWSCAKSIIASVMWQHHKCNVTWLYVLCGTTVYVISYHYIYTGDKHVNNTWVNSKGKKSLMSWPNYECLWQTTGKKCLRRWWFSFFFLCVWKALKCYQTLQTVTGHPIQDGKILEFVCLWVKPPLYKNSYGIIIYNHVHNVLLLVILLLL